MDEHRYPIAIVWRELLAGDLSTLGRIESVARCRDSKTGCYRHLRLVGQLDEHAAHCAMRATHELLWIDWMRASLEQQHADLLLYLRNRSKDSAEMERKIGQWKINAPFAALPPVSVGGPERALFLQTLSSLLNMLRAEYCSPHDASRSFQRVLALVRHQYRKVEFSLGTLSTATGISERHLSRLFRHHLGKTFLQVLRETRISEASALLIGSEYGIKEVAGMVGYPHSSRFGKDFRLLMRCTPAEFRRRPQRMCPA